MRFDTETNNRHNAEMKYTMKQQYLCCQMDTYDIGESWSMGGKFITLAD